MDEMKIKTQCDTTAYTYQNGRNTKSFNNKTDRMKGNQLSWMAIVNVSLYYLKKNTLFETIH